MKNPRPLSPKRRHARSWLDELLNARSWRLTALRGCPDVHVRNDSTSASPAAHPFRMAASSPRCGPADGEKVGVRRPRTLLEPGQRRLGTFPSPTLSPAKIMLTRSIRLPERSQATVSIPSRPCSLAGRRAARRTPIYLLITHRAEINGMPREHLAQPRSPAQLARTPRAAGEAIQASFPTALTRRQPHAKRLRARAFTLEARRDCARTDGCCLASSQVHRSRPPSSTPTILGSARLLSSR